MNYKTTNRLLKKGSRRAVFYQVLCAVAILAVIAPASYLYGVMTAGEGINFSLYQRVFSETVHPAGDSSFPEFEVADALMPFGPTAIEKATYNGLVIWTTSTVKPGRSWERELAREWGRQGISAQVSEGMVRGILHLGGDRCILLARDAEIDGVIEIFAYEESGSSSGDAFQAAGLPKPPTYAEIFDYSGSTDTGVALAFRADHRGDLVGEYANLLEQNGWKPLPVAPDREGALLFEHEGKRVTLRGLESGYYTYVTLVVF